MTHLTGPQHYREAERLLAQAEKRFADDDGRTKTDWWVRRTSDLLRIAQVHATLSVAAAPCPDDAA